MPATHTDRLYEAELTTIRNRFSTMAENVGEMLKKSIASFYTNDLETAYRVIQQDNAVDRDDREISELCVNTIARRQPLGPDLRLIMAVQKSITDLERIADLCVNTAERTIELAQQPSIQDNIELKPMADSVIRMFHDITTAFRINDSSVFKRVHQADRMVDAHYAQLFRTLLELMRHDGSIVSQATRIISFMNNLERTGDHTKNISEKIAYLVDGPFIHRNISPKKDIRGILFLCVQNSARSQMAEGWARRLLPRKIAIFSAGSAPAENINPYAVEVMAEAGIDISGQRPKRITDVPLGKVDMVITLCAEEVCVNLPDLIQRETWTLPDPAAGSPKNNRATFIDVRNTIRDHMENLADALTARKG